MKKNKKFFIFFVALILSSFLLILSSCKKDNDNEYFDSLIYTEITRNDEVVAYSVSGIESPCVKDIIIPSVHNNLPVTAIEDKAFCNCEEIYSVIIPDSVSIIGDQAFYSCYNLYYIEIGSGLNYIGSQAFYNCYKLVEIYNKSLIDIRYGSTDNGYIGYYALNRFTPTKGKTKIVSYDDFIIYEGEDDGFVIGYVGNKENIEIPSFYNGKELVIYKYAFYNNTNIYNVASLYYQTSIADYAFYGCTNLINIDFHRYHMESIGNYAFYGCTSLTNLTLPYGLKTIGSNAFSNCTFISHIKFDTLRCSALGAAFENVGKDCDECRVEISGDCIPASLFSNSYITHVEFDKEDEFLDIGERAFSNCKKLSTLILPNPESPPTLTTSSIGAYAFLNCSSLSNIRITRTIGFIGRYAFSNCTNLNGVIFDRISGWKAYYNDYNIYNISETKLVSSQDAATVLKEEYIGYDWKCYK